MRKPTKLNVLGAGDSKLGQATIMDRVLAQKYGAAYVHTAAFAIDVDRVLRASEDHPTLPFGWDVALTDLYLCQFVAPRPEALNLLDDLVLSVLDLAHERAAEAAPLGSQLPFAVFSALERDALPAGLRSCFRSWKKPPVALARDVAQLLAAPEQVATLCNHCLTTPLSPPLVEPVREALNELQTA